MGNNQSAAGLQPGGSLSLDVDASLAQRAQSEEAIEAPAAPETSFAPYNPFDRRGTDFNFPPLADALRFDPTTTDQEASRPSDIETLANLYPVEFPQVQLSQAPTSYTLHEQVAVDVWFRRQVCVCGGGGCVGVAE